MRAAVLRAYGEPLALGDVPVPEPDEETVLVRVRACGLCGTDLKIAAGKLAEATVPRILGHEVAGEVADDADGLRRGQRVACHVPTACGACAWCRRGEEALCPRAVRIGFQEDGGLAEYVRVRRRNALPFAEHVPFADAAVAMDAVLTPWRALRVRARLQPGETLVVAGAGGLGLNAVQIARHAGARVAVVDPLADHRAEAERLGAELAVAPEQAGRVREWSDGGADVGLEASGRRAGFDAVVAGVRSGGRVVVCGYEAGREYGVDAVRLALQELQLLGSRAGTLADARETLRAVEQGVVEPTVTERLPLEAANEALERLRSGSVLGRLVIEP